MNSKISRKEAQEKIDKFFLDTKNKAPKEVKKIKRISANKKIPLKEKRKLFCKKCLGPYSGNEKIRLRSGKKSIRCFNCGYIARWKVK